MCERRLIDVDSLYGRVLQLERDANKAFPDYKRGIQAVQQLISNAPTIDVDAIVATETKFVTVTTGNKSARFVFEEAAATAYAMEKRKTDIVSKLDT